MSVVDRTLQTQLRNIESRTGQSLAELTAYVDASGLTKHGQIRDMLKQTLGLGYGDANTLTHYVLTARVPAGAEQAATPDAAIAALYSGTKADLRPIHDELMAEIEAFGAFEVAPRKTYVSLRRRKQFAMIGPATRSQVEVGLNAKSLPPNSRLTEQPTGRMCRYKTRLASPKEVDEEVITWIRQAYDEAG